MSRRPQATHHDAFVQELFTSARLWGDFGLWVCRAHPAPPVPQACQVQDMAPCRPPSTSEDSRYVPKCLCCQTAPSSVSLTGGTQVSCSSADRLGVCPWTPEFQVWHLQKKAAVRGGHVGSSREVPGALHCGWVTVPCLPAPALLLPWAVAASAHRGPRGPSAPVPLLSPCASEAPGPAPFLALAGPTDAPVRRHSADTRALCRHGVSARRAARLTPTSLSLRVPVCETDLRSCSGVCEGGRSNVCHSVPPGFLHCVPTLMATESARGLIWG